MGGVYARRAVSVWRLLGGVGVVSATAIMLIQSSDGDPLRGRRFRDRYPDVGKDVVVDTSACTTVVGP